MSDSFDAVPGFFSNLLSHMLDGSTSRTCCLLDIVSRILS
jgi:hypothetical protein